MALDQVRNDCVGIRKHEAVPPMEAMILKFLRRIDVV